MGYVSVSTYLGRRRIRIKFSLVPHYNRAGVIKMNEIPNNKIARFNVNMTLNAFLLQSADGFSIFLLKEIYLREVRSKFYHK